MGKDVMETVCDWIKESKKIIVLTGSELSAESGVPDFSDPKINPDINDFRANRDVRAQYWGKIKELYPVLAEAKPNPAHEALAELEMIGNLDSIFTQTTDGLHQRAGSSSVMELNSTILWVTCTSCGKDYRTDEILSSLEKGKEVPECNVCGKDILKPPISFPGQPPPHWEVREAWMRLRNCDLFLVVGSSLDAQPVSSFPTLAKENGAKVVIISEREGTADDYADAVIYGKPSQVLPHIIKKVKEGITLS
jgi:NAD-dependent protein deacetylase/lipoamidase